MEPFPLKHLSADRHLQEAAAHDRLAAENVELSKSAARAEAHTSQKIRCLDRPLEGITYSGGEAIEILRPCWTSVTSPSEGYAAKAKRHRESAAWHRQRAHELRTTEKIACAGLGEDEIATSPFARTEDILSVHELREGASLRGAIVVFRKVPGLTGPWMHKSMHCHYARAAALGFPTDFMGACPTTLPDVQIEVAELPDGIVVTIRSERDEIAAAAYGRAADLQRGQEPLNDTAQPR
jgi:hypothetical protein